MTNPTITIHNVETGEIVDREMNLDEIAEYEKTVKQSKTRAAALQSEADTKAALLDRLGITADEAALLLK